MKDYIDSEFFDSPFRGVTSILNAIFGNKFENTDIPEYILKAAGERGTACHSYLENYQKWLLGEIKEEPHLGLEYAIYETNFKEFLNDRCEIIKPILIEYKTINKQYGIKGIIDSVAEFKNKGDDNSFIALVDWKTSSNLDLWTTECQLQLYYYMLLHGDKEERKIASQITQLRCLSLTKRGYKWQRFKINIDLAESLIYLWNIHFQETSNIESIKDGKSIEEWKSIDDKYRISTMGRIMHYDSKRKQYLFAIGTENHNGYLKISKQEPDGKYKTYLIHRLVAQTFLENDDPQHKTQVRHKNKNNKDNRVTNLEWVTPKENSTYAGE